MIIAELNHLEPVNEEIVGAGGPKIYTDIWKDVHIDVDVNLDIKKNVKAYVNIYGNLATSEASADAYGYNSLAETETFTQATYYSSEAFSQSTSAVY